MGIDAVVVRHGSAGVPWQISRWIDASVVNAGDGWHEHPTQALLDCYTIRSELGPAVGGPPHRHRRRRQAQPGRPLRRARLHRARAPRSRWWRRPRCCRPSLEGWPPVEVDVSHDLDDVLPKLDVVYLLRMQLERQERGAGAEPAGVHRRATA